MSGDIILLNDTYFWYHWSCTGTSMAIRNMIQATGVSLTCVPIKYTYTLKTGLNPWPISIALKEYAHRSSKLR